MYRKTGNMQRIRTYIPRILNRLGYFNNRIYIRKMKFHGITWKIPVIDFIGYGNALGFESEPWIFHLMSRIHLLEKIDYYIDVGVNTGQSLLKIKSIDRDIPYLGFEPNPNCVFYVDYLIRLNNLGHARIICLGLGNSETLLRLNFEGIEDTRASLLEENKIKNNLVFSKEVPIYQFDKLDLTFIQGENIILKIDVEGFEPEVLMGASMFVRRNAPIIIFEVLPHLQKQEIIERQENLYTQLMELNYHIFHININYSIKEMTSGFNNESDYTQTDFIAVPESKYALYNEISQTMYFQP